ncbi:MAG TPA: hypothetical protein VE826_00175 [Dongiaceae bacterium]|nr:hypothetical protein [Dongiaceae bacterium]
MPIETRFDDLDLREEPARAGADRGPLLGSSGATDLCTATVGCSKNCCTCPPPFA